ncbi:spore germination protein [Halalkalibacillus halophilus]|uniref:spore germination protein n=1 Tax=Halalkalibacillus halophilus TaxID=392827 RepID=UPI00040A63D8|nr:spore germination protein [Halalkalibacillus halophilus]
MRRRTNKSKGIFPCQLTELEKKLHEDYFLDSPDLTTKQIDFDNKSCVILYLNHMVRKQYLYNQLIKPIQFSTTASYEQFKRIVPVAGDEALNTLDAIGEELIGGAACVYIEGEDYALTFPVPKLEKRNPERAEAESLIFGPKISFTESLDTNLNIVHWRMDTKTLKVEKFIIGNTVPTEVRLIYLEELANEDNVIEMRRRLEELSVDDIIESSTLTQYIEDNSYTIFPQFLVTELPDRFCYSLKEGKLGLLVDKSPTGIIAPINFLSFFESTEDLYTRWSMGSFIRVMRIVAMFISVVLTPLYVAALTFHYEIIPTALLVSLGHSRSRVPFPPLIEAFVLEILIELVREAGARLPTKVGQTMGIVGGIVIGQAVVQAGFTSNILIIIVALSALASYTAPSYLMGSAIRIIRFPIILLAGMWGFIGIIFSLSFIVIHLIKQRSLNRPYFAPIYPFQPRDVDNSLIRLPFLSSNKRAYSGSPKKITRFKKPNKNKPKDIDE